MRTLWGILSYHRKGVSNIRQKNDKDKLPNQCPYCGGFNTEPYLCVENARFDEYLKILNLKERKICSFYAQIGSPKTT